MPSIDEQYDAAIALQQAGNLDGAIGQLQAILAEQPDFALAHAALGVFLGKLDRHNEAVEHRARSATWSPTTRSASWP